MNLLSRKNSNGGRHGEGRNASPDPENGHGKPGLLRRLSRRASRSGDGQEGPQEVGRHSGVGVGVDESSLATKETPAPESSKRAPPMVTSKVPPTTTPTATESRQHAPQAPEPKQAVKSSAATTGLTKEEVHQLFSGAPQYLLEKGRRGRYFPQAFFPWNTDLDISDLQDRRFLRHESFALSTLHAHLPIPDELHAATTGLTPVAKREGLGTGKRPMFELGIFERPNMLGIEGREPGTIGMRYFLERPVADGAQNDRVKEHGKDVEIDLAIANAPVIEAFKMLALSHDNEQANAKIGKHAPTQNREELVRGGPASWKKVGVRAISMQTLADRLVRICSWRDDVVNAGWRITVLDKMTSDELHAHLFNELIFPPRRSSSDVKYDPRQKDASLKVQIEALVKVLTTPGAWVDLTLPDSRLDLGRIVFNRASTRELPTGGVCVDSERKWLLIQLLLSVELVLRLDAALRVGLAQHSESLELTADEIHHFNKLRNLKVDWDLVAARRLLFNCYVKKIDHGAHQPRDRPAHVENRPSSHERGLLGGIRHSLGLSQTRSEATHDECDIAVLPYKPHVMIEGLAQFGKLLCWPRWEAIEKELQAKLCETSVDVRENFLMDAVPKDDSLPGHLAHATAPPPIAGPHVETGRVDLCAANPKSVGGWLSHTWLSSMILPGNAICDILMSALLENDVDPNTLKKLGSARLPLRSAGFVLDGSSWWSKSSILARVMAPMPGSKESMGWVYLPNFTALNASSSTPLPDGWYKIKVFPVSTVRDQPRIFVGDRLGLDSSPLGIGEGAIKGSEFSMVTDHVLDMGSPSHVVITGVKVFLSSFDGTATDPDHPLSAWVQFNLDIVGSPSARPKSKEVRFGLDRDVYFVSAHPCHLPHGHATFKPGSSDAQQEQHHPHHQAAEVLPAHPLHKSYTFVAKTLVDIVDQPDVRPSDAAAADGSAVWVIDARESFLPGQTPSHPAGGEPPANARSLSGGTPDYDSRLWGRGVLARAWCAEKGLNAIVAREGKCCISCAIREAKALEISVIIRVGMC